MAVDVLSEDRPHGHQHHHHGPAQECDELAFGLAHGGTESFGFSERPYINTAIENKIAESEGVVYAGIREIIDSQLPYLSGRVK